MANYFRRPLAVSLWSTRVTLKQYGLLMSPGAEPASSTLESFVSSVGDISHLTHLFPNFELLLLDCSIPSLHLGGIASSSIQMFLQISGSQLLLVAWMFVADCHWPQSYSSGAIEWASSQSGHYFSKQLVTVHAGLDVQLQTLCIQRTSLRKKPSFTQASSCIITVECNYSPSINQEWRYLEKREQRLMGPLFPLTTTMKM